MEVKKAIALRDIMSHPEAYNSRKGFLHRHNTSGETRIKYDGY